MKIFYDPHDTNVFSCCADGYALQRALDLKRHNIYTNNYLVVLAAKLLVLQRELESFTLVVDDIEYQCNNPEGFNNEPDTPSDQLLEQILKEKYERRK